MEGVDVQHHPFSTSDLDEDDWSCSLTSLFTPKETAFYTHWIRSLVTSVQVEVLRRRWKYLAFAGNRTVIIQTSSLQPSHYAEYVTGFMFNLQVQRKIAWTVVGISLLNGSSEQLHAAESLQKPAVSPLVKNLSACTKTRYLCRIHLSQLSCPYLSETKQT